MLRPMLNAFRREVSCTEAEWPEVKSGRSPRLICRTVPFGFRPVKMASIRMTRLDPVNLSIKLSPPSETQSTSTLGRSSVYLTISSATCQPTPSSPSIGLPRPITSVFIPVVGIERRQIVLVPSTVFGPWDYSQNCLSTSRGSPSGLRTIISSGIWPGSEWVAHPKQGS
jgi:hypothetical protein